MNPINQHWIMSSTNSRLNPPSSIRVGDNDDNDNNTSIGESKSPFATEVKADATGTTATATIASPDIDSVIQGFQKELDSLSRSFDMMATSRSKRSEKASTTPATLRHESNQSFSRFDSTPAAPKNEFSAAPPPPMTQVAGRSDTDSRSTQKSNPRYAADETFATATTTTRFEEPRPVETPVLSTGYSTTSHDYRRRRYADIDDFQDRNLFPSQTEKRLEARIQTMKEIMNEQSATILRLQRENNDLRKRLSQGMPQYSKQTSKGRDPPEPIFESSNRQKNSTHRTTHDHYSERISYDPTPRTERNHHYSSYYDDEMKPTVSSLTTIPRDDDDENTLETTPIAPSRAGHGFTPGTKFVAELSKFMTINQGHSVPLSVIIDRHWDKLKYHMRDEANTDLL